uniref:Uncharacterized protein n=1 Tax=Manihot esculenta TaxID=3983 RepID=A0A2C9WHW7_MANES
MHARELSYAREEDRAILEKIHAFAANSKNIRIKVRIARTWHFYSAYNPTDLFSFDFFYD